MKEKIRIILADDHVLVRNGIKLMLEKEEEIEVIGEADNGEQAIRQVNDLHPDIAILDIRMPGMSGLEAAARLKDENSTTRAVILSMHDSEDYVIQAVQSGAYGYLLKDIDKSEFIKAIKQVYQGIKYYSGAISGILAEGLLSRYAGGKPPAPKENKYNLTPREKEILKLIVEGKQNKNIAGLLGKSVRTIETHRFNIMKKLEVNNAIDMVNKTLKENLVD